MPAILSRVIAAAVVAVLFVIVVLGPIKLIDFLDDRKLTDRTTIYFFVIVGTAVTAIIIVSLTTG